MSAQPDPDSPGQPVAVLASAPSSSSSEAPEHQYRKIARLPKVFRDLINHLLDDSVPYHPIIARLEQISAWRGRRCLNAQLFLHHFCTTFCTFGSPDLCKSTTYDQGIAPCCAQAIRYPGRIRSNPHQIEPIRSNPNSSFFDQQLTKY